MIEKDDLVEIGKFQKTHALKGELNAILDIDAEYVEDEGPIVMDVDGIFVPFFVDSIRTKGATSYLVKLEGVDTEEEARQFVNKIIYAPKDEIRDYYEDEDISFADDFNGFEVWDEKNGFLGSVNRIDDATQNILLIVDSEDGRQLFIPFAPDFIREINEDSKRILMSLPDGLLDLN